MPTSSTSARAGTSSTPAAPAANSKRNYWHINTHHHHPNKHSNYNIKRSNSNFSDSSSSFQKKTSRPLDGSSNKQQSTSANKYNQQQQQHRQHTKHTSTNLNSSSALKINTSQMALNKESSLSAAAAINLGAANQVVITKPSGVLNSNATLDSLASLESFDSKQQISNQLSGLKVGSSKTYQQQLVNSIQFPSSHSQSSLALANTSGGCSSTTQLHNSYANSNTNNNQTNTTSFSIKRNVNLKYIKTIIILLLALDLIITVFVHQFSTQDYLSVWFTSMRMRFSLLNLILSAIWFVILIGAILFDVYFILFVSSLVHFSSFVLLLIFSFIHFTRRIDYNTVNLASLLALLFSIILLHVYLLVLFALTIYLMQAVRRRQKMPK